MSVLFLALAAGFTGSFHCVGMCGPLASMHGLQSGTRGMALYQLGRGIAYGILGLGAGLLGRQLTHSVQLLMWQRILVLFMGIGMIGMGVLAFFGRTQIVPAQWTAKVQKVLPAKWFQGRRASLSWGLLSALLPCGYLHSFVLAAGATGSAGQAILFMLAFWLGTTPSLVGSGLIMKSVGREVSGKLALFTPIFLIVFGILALVGKWVIPFGSNVRCFPFPGP